ncbi:MAG: hypothetical protein V4535_11345, partial [Bacteroidota bacterium]
MKNRKLLATLVLLFSAITFAQSPVNGGFENGAINNVTDWAGHGGTGTSTVTTTNARTGTYSLNHATTSNLAAPTQDNINATTISVPGLSYFHAIGWAKGTDVNAKAQMRCTVNITPTSGTQSANGALNNATLRLTVSAQNITGSPQNAYCRTSSRSLTNGSLTNIYWDDIIMYTSSSATPDLTQPGTATAFTQGATLASSVTFTWAFGTDAATGVQNTIILRTANLAAGAPVMNDQGVYSVAGGASGPNTVSTDWTVLSTSVGAIATAYTDNTVTPGTSYKYAIIHRDLAYNYSPALVSGTIICPGVITSTTTGGLWSVGSTWVNGVAPTSNDDVVIVSGATVTLDSATTRNTGTNTTVNLGGTLATGTFAYNNNSGSSGTTINGTFKLDASGSVTGNNFVYGAASTLILNTAVTISGAEQYWPASGPY